MEITADQYRLDRQKHADAMIALGVNPYGASIPDAERYDWDVACNIAWHCMKMAHVDEKLSLVPNTDLTPQTGPINAGYGRIVLRREMGNLHFLTIRDYTGDVQVALNKKMLPERDWKVAKLLDLGDIITFTGRCAPTQKGEPTLWATDIGMAAKSMSPPPAKFEGMTDIELRYRKRYTDLWSNPDAMKTALLRSKVVASIRSTLARCDFVEVETPILQTIAGGAAAKPFITKHNALDIEMYLRITPELYLKRLLVGGMPKVFEIGRNFRNEGLSPRHNPEFTALEMYEAFSDFEQMAEFVEAIVHDITLKLPDLEVKFPHTWWRRAKMVDLVKEFCSKGVESGNILEMSTQSPTPEDWHNFYVEHVEHTLIEPTFVTHLPASAVPLAQEDGEGFAMCFELIINGQEIGCGYTEQNDPRKQLERLKQQSGEDQHKIDEDFVEALCVGMPPAGGVGIGIDRLVMALTGEKSVRDVILFPTMKPK